MARKINQIKLLDNELSRQLSFGKRRNGLIKKALELYMVCDVDVVFIAFSPSGRLSCFCGDKRVEDVVSRFLALPEQTRRFHIPDLELQLLVDILNKLKDQTQEHIQRDCTISAIQREVAQVKEEIECLLLETRRYEPLQEAIMTMEEAKIAEETLEEALISVQQRKNELTADNQDHEDASQSYDSYVLPQQKESQPSEHNKDESQPSDYEIEAENSLPKPFEEVQQVEPQQQPNEDADINYQYPTLERIYDMLSGWNSSSEDTLLQAAAPQPQLASSSLVTTSVVTETFSPIGPPEKNIGSSSGKHQFSFSRDDVFDSSPNWNSIHQTSVEYNDQSIYGSENGFNFPISNLISSNFRSSSSPASYQVPRHQILSPMQAPSYCQEDQLPIAGSSSNTLLLGNPQWGNLRDPQPLEIPFRQTPNFRNFQNSVSGLDNTYTESESESSASILRPLNLQMNNQSMGDRNYMGPNLSQNLQGPLLNYYQQVQFEVQGSSSSAQKRKLPWDNGISPRLFAYLNGNSSYPNNTIPPEPSLSSYQNGNTAYPNNTIPLEPSLPSYQNANTAYPYNTIPLEPSLSSYQNGITTYPNCTIPLEPRVSSHQIGNTRYPNNSISPSPRFSTNAVYDAEYEVAGLPVDPHFRSLQNMILPENDNDYWQKEYHR